MVIMYTTSWCGYCRRLKVGLNRAGIAYDEIDVDRDADAAKLVMEINGGNRTVPTVVFADGSTLTNPSVAQIADKLAA